MYSLNICLRVLIDIVCVYVFSRFSIRVMCVYCIVILVYMYVKIWIGINKCRWLRLKLN